MTKDAVVAAILDHWNREFPKEVKAHDPVDVREAAEARASMAEAEMETLMAIGVQTREEAWSDAARIFLKNPPLIAT